MPDSFTEAELATLWAALTYEQRTILMGGTAAWPDTLSVEERAAAEASLEVQGINRDVGVGHELVSFGTHLLLTLELLNEDQIACLQNLDKGKEADKAITEELQGLGLVLESGQLAPMGQAILEFTISTSPQLRRREARTDP